MKYKVIASSVKTNSFDSQEPKTKIAQLSDGTQINIPIGTKVVEKPNGEFEIIPETTKVEAPTENEIKPEKTTGITIFNFTEEVPIGSTIATKEEATEYIKTNHDQLLEFFKDSARKQIQAMGMPQQMIYRVLEADPKIISQIKEEIKALSVIKTPDNTFIPIKTPKDFNIYKIDEKGAILVISKNSKIPANSRIASLEEKEVFLKAEKLDMEKELTPKIQQMMNTQLTPMLTARFTQQLEKEAQEELTKKGVKDQKEITAALKLQAPKIREKANKLIQESIKETVTQKTNEIIEKSLKETQLIITTDGQKKAIGIPEELKLIDITADGKLILGAGLKIAGKPNDEKLPAGTQLLKDTVSKKEYHKLRTAIIKKAEESGLELPVNFELVILPEKSLEKLPVAPYTKVPKGHILTSIKADGTPIFEKGLPEGYDSADEFDDPVIRKKYMETRSKMTTMSQVLDAWVKAKPNKIIDEKMVYLIADTEELNEKNIPELSTPYQDILRQMKNLMESARTEDGNYAWDDKYINDRSTNPKKDPAFKKKFDEIVSKMKSKDILLKKWAESKLNDTDDKSILANFKTLEILDEKGLKEYSADYQSILTQIKSTLDTTYKHFYI